MRQSNANAPSTAPETPLADNGTVRAPLSDAAIRRTGNEQYAPAALIPYTPWQQRLLGALGSGRAEDRRAHGYDRFIHSFHKGVAIFRGGATRKSHSGRGGRSVESQELVVTTAEMAEQSRRGADLHQVSGRALVIFGSCSVEGLFSDHLLCDHRGQSLGLSTTSWPFPRARGVRDIAVQVLASGWARGRNCPRVYRNHSETHSRVDLARKRPRQPQPGP